MRGKKIMYIGDSLSLNNFESLLCLLHGTVPGVKYREEFTALNVTVTFLVSLLYSFWFFFWVFWSEYCMNSKIWYGFAGVWSWSHPISLRIPSRHRESRGKDEFLQEWRNMEANGCVDLQQWVMVDEEGTKTTVKQTTNQQFYYHYHCCLLKSMFGLKFATVTCFFLLLQVGFHRTGGWPSGERHEPLWCLWNGSAIMGKMGWKRCGSYQNPSFLPIRSCSPLHVTNHLSTHSWISVAKISLRHWLIDA